MNNPKRFFRLIGLLFLLVLTSYFFAPQKEPRPLGVELSLNGEKHVLKGSSDTPSGEGVAIVSKENLHLNANEANGDFFQLAHLKFSGALNSNEDYHTDFLPEENPINRFHLGGQSYLATKADWSLTNLDSNKISGRILLECVPAPETHTSGFPDGERLEVEVFFDLHLRRALPKP